MKELKRYQAVNNCETFEELSEVIKSFAGKDGMIQGKNREFNAERMSEACLNFNPRTANYLTRNWGIRQQALYINLYN